MPVVGAENKSEEANANTDKPKTSKLGQMIASAIQAEMAPVKSWQKKINGEMADRRRGGKSPDEANDDQPEKKSAAAATRAALTDEDLDAATEIGELRAKLPKALLEEMADELKDMSHRQRRDALKMLVRGQGSRGETPNKSRDQESVSTRTPRGTPPPVSDPVPRPRSLQEYAQLAKTDPKAYARLNADESFDPSDLPGQTPR